MADDPDTLLELAQFICGREDADENADRLARGYRDLHERVFAKDSRVVLALTNMVNSGWRVALEYAPDNIAPPEGTALVVITKPTDARVFVGNCHEEVLVEAWETVKPA